MTAEKVVAYPGAAAAARHARGAFAVWVFLVSDAMFFIGLIGMYLVLRGSSGAWPPEGLPRPGRLLPAVNTLLLLFGSVSMTLALRDARANRQGGIRRNLAVTALLGAAFLAGQGFEAWRLTNAGLTLRGSILGNVLYTIAGFHGLHVLAGLLIVLALLARALRGKYTSASHLGILGGGLFWHFLTATWLVLFVLLFLV